MTALAFINFGPTMAAYLGEDTAIGAVRWSELTDEQLRQLLVLFGEEDRRWRASSAAEFRAVPGATVEMLPGVGHSPNLEDPPLTAVPLLAFTAGV